jgi:hypothetical protein
MSTLHDQIMNLKVSEKTAAHVPSVSREWYFLGVRDARHAAAELALQADAQLDAVRAAVQGYYAALDRREHGIDAHNQAFLTIQRVLGMEWKPGASLNPTPTPTKET